MIYSQYDFGVELIEEINRGYDIVRISRWAYSVYLKHAGDIDEQLEKIIMTVVAIGEGPEFEYSCDQLIQMANELKAK
jgi:hypothetical protein